MTNTRSPNFSNKRAGWPVTGLTRTSLLEDSGEAFNNLCQRAREMKTLSKTGNDILDKKIDRLMDETRLLRQVRDDTRRMGGLAEDGKQRLIEAFQKRFNQAMELVEEEKVSKYVFSPSGRTIWVVAGKHGEYQVLPERMFCSCDDYFFRVMSRKKQGCYHLFAHQMGEALGKYRTTDLADSNYAQITSKCTLPPLQS